MQSIGLPLKVQKHLAGGNLDKAAFYLTALLQQAGGRPDDGSAEREMVDQLKAVGYRFFCQDGNILCQKPNGKFYVGQDALADWNKLFA